MIQIVLIGLGAGAAAALLFASMVSGAPAALLLLLLAPLPILIVSLGWSHWAGLIAAATAGGCLAVVVPEVGAAFLVGVGFPAWWLGYLTLLARPTAAGSVSAPAGPRSALADSRSALTDPRSDLINARSDPGDPRSALADPRSALADPEWYPVGRLVLWAAGISAVLVGATLLTLGTDLTTLQNTLRPLLDTHLDDVIADQLDDPAEAARLVDFMLMFLPGAVAASLALVTVLNLWLAGRIVKISQRLSRPWPRISDMRFPAFAPAVLGAAVAGSFLPDLIGLSFSAVAASLMIAHVLLGLAVIHAVTVGLNARGFILGSVYAAIVLFSWPIRWPLLVIGLLGIGDALFDLRTLIARRRGPPATPPPYPPPQAGEG
jgi:hypothetical protein